MTKTFRLVEGNLQDRFLKSRSKLRLFGGGFGNGKTTSEVILGLQLAKDYPGANILVARSTYPKLNDTIRKEFLDWTPASWIKRKVLSGQENMIELNNGTKINFRYVAQQGKSNESSTSNLLSATYDVIIIDQIEDPEISHKDFLDLLGRLRGNTPYRGDDPTMPTTGPRWLIMACNPTRNWVYRELVKPVFDFKLGIKNPKLIVNEDTGQPALEIFEGSTYENKDNLPEDFIAMQEAAYKGQMRERFLLGNWGAFEGLIYPDYDPAVHTLDHIDIYNYFKTLQEEGFNPTMIEAYDHGIAKPSCFIQYFVDPFGNVFAYKGFHEAELMVSEAATKIKRLRASSFQESVGPLTFTSCLADPALFRRTPGLKTAGVTVSDMFRDEGVKFARANNDIISGIAKVQSYLHIDTAHRHPITGTLGSPRLFFSNNLQFIDEEITDYYWKKDTSGEYTDKPNDRNDHAMDNIKYALSKRPKIANFYKKRQALPNRLLRWGEYEAKEINKKGHRYG